MGAYRTQALSLSPWMYATFDTYNWTPPDPVTSPSTLGEIQAFQLGGGLSRRPSMVRTESGDTTAGGFTMVDQGGEMVSKAPEWTYVFTVSLETGDSGPPVNQGTPYVSSSGFFQVHVGLGASGPQPWWDLHETLAGTIGIAAMGYWSDRPATIPNPSPPPFGDVTVYGRYDNDLNSGTTGSDHCYIYDTGIPVGDLMDGRPHLLAIRTLGADQPYSPSGPITTTTSISISIDGVHRYTSARGQSWGDANGIAGHVTLTLSSTGSDEFGIWKRQLSDAEIASLWGPTVWGDLASWPHLGSSTTGSYATTSTPDPILRILSEPELTRVDFTTSEPDPVWVEEEAVGSADASGVVSRASMGQATWAGQGPWNSTRDRGLAYKWLEMDDANINLLTGPIVGVSMAYAELEQQVGQAAGSSSGRSSVSGDLTVAIPLEAGEIHSSSTVYAITIGDLATLAASSSGASTVTADLSHGQTELLTGESAGSSSVSGDLLVTRYTLIGGEEVDGNGMPIGGGRRRAHFSPLSVGYASERAQGIATAGAGVGIDGIGLGS